MPQAKAEPKPGSGPQQKGEGAKSPLFFNYLDRQSLSLTQRGPAPMVRAARKGHFVPKNRA
jgi:hypothetical protein